MLTRLIDAPREKLYRAWTEPALLKQWFAPLPWTTPHAELDVRPGGASTITMRSPDGNDMPCPGVYLEVVPNRAAGIHGCLYQRMAAIAEAVHDGDPDLRGRGRQDTLHRPRAPLDSRRPRGAREDGLPRRAGASVPTSSRRSQRRYDIVIARSAATKQSPPRLRKMWISLVAPPLAMTPTPKRTLPPPPRSRMTASACRGRRCSP